MSDTLRYNGDCEEICQEICFFALRDHSGFPRPGARSGFTCGTAPFLKRRQEETRSRSNRTQQTSVLQMFCPMLNKGGIQITLAERIHLLEKRLPRCSRLPKRRIHQYHVILLPAQVHEPQPPNRVLREQPPPSMTKPKSRIGRLTKIFQILCNLLIILQFFKKAQCVYRVL